MDRYEVEDTLGEFSFCEYTNAKGTIPYRIHIPESGAKGAPLLLFMHGAGERGTDNTLQLRAALDVFARCNPEVKEAVIIAPQCPRNCPADNPEEETWVKYPWYLGNYSTDAIPETWELEAVVELLLKNVRELGVDEDRVYVMGLSMGGFATWDLLARHSELFAAAMPICGAGDPSKVDLFKDIPIRTFHGSVDDTVPPTGTREMTRALRDAGAEDFSYIEFPGIGHWSWDLACSYPGIGKWMFSQNRKDRINNSKNNTNRRKIMKTVKDKQVLVAADFAGVELKNAVVAHLEKNGWTCTDVGVKTTDEEHPEMFHRIGFKVGSMIAEGEFERALIFCGTGMGIHIAASKCPHVYAAVCETPHSALRAITGNNCNVLAMGGHWIGHNLGIEMAEAFLYHNMGDGYEWWPNFYEFHKLAYDELEAFDYEEYKANGFQVKKLGEVDLPDCPKPEELKRR